MTLGTKTPASSIESSIHQHVKLSNPPGYQQKETTLSISHEFLHNFTHISPHHCSEVLVFPPQENTQILWRANLILSLVLGICHCKLHFLGGLSAPIKPIYMFEFKLLLTHATTCPQVIISTGSCYISRSLL